MCTSLLDYAYIGSRVAQRSYGVPNTHFEPTYDNLGRVDIHRTYHPTNGDIVNFDYDYVDNENNIYRKTFDHRTNDPYNQYAYDDLDRVIDVDYLVNGSTPDHEETFYMDTLGNRTGNQTLTDGTVNFTVQSSTNRYTSIGGNSISHDDAGNMTTVYWPSEFIVLQFDVLSAEIYDLGSRTMPGIEIEQYGILANFNS